MAKKSMIPFNVEFVCYYNEPEATNSVFEPKVTNASGELITYANDISEAIELAKKKLTGFVGDSFEVRSVTKGLVWRRNGRSYRNDF